MLYIKSSHDGVVIEASPCQDKEQTNQKYFLLYYSNQTRLQGLGILYQKYQYGGVPLCQAQQPITKIQSHSQLSQALMKKCKDKSYNNGDNVASLYEEVYSRTSRTRINVFFAVKAYASVLPNHQLRLGYFLKTILLYTFFANFP